MFCRITKRKARHKPLPSGVYRDATWRPIYPGATDYCFSGEEILRPARYQLRIALLERLPRASPRRRRIWTVAMIDYWEIVDDFLDTLRRPWYRQASVWGIHEGRIATGLRHHFPGATEAQYRGLLAIVMPKFEPLKAAIIADYRGGEEFPLQHKRIAGDAAQHRPGPSDDARRERPETGRRRRVERVLDQLVSFRSIRDKALARDLVAAGYRQLALKRHPDRGGSAEAMHALTELKDQMLRLLAEEGREDTRR